MAAAAASSGPEVKVTHEDTQYLENKTICETVDNMLAAACASKASVPEHAFVTSLIEANSNCQMRRVLGDEMRRDTKLTNSKAWKELQSASFTQANSIQALFQQSGSRAENMSVTVNLEGDSNVAGDKKNALLFDYSKQYMSSGVVGALNNVATHVKLADAITKMKDGEKVNWTEKRSAFHIALRGSGNADVEHDGKKVKDLVAAELKKTQEISEAVRSGSLKGSSGAAIKHVVHIGTGGSVLGTQAAVQALAPFGAKDISFHFVSSFDSAQIESIKSQIDVAATLFVIAGKTFTTAETINAAEAFKAVVAAKFPADKQAVAKHFVAVTAAPERATAFGIDASKVISFWDFVGGRYSVWSGVGVTLAIACGYDNFKQFLDGAAAIDNHFFSTTDFTKNVPAMMGLSAVYNHNLQHTSAHAVVPYASRLGLIPAYLQQLEMESLGKSVTVNNLGAEVRTTPVIMGVTGPEAQHSFFQALHQGTSTVSVDFIGAAQPQKESEAAGQIQLTANMLAQARALMVGVTRQEVQQELSRTNERLSTEELHHRVLPGSKPNSTFLFKKLTPMALGALLAAYEHKVFVQAAVWGINPFDQFGVECGKKIATALVPQLGKDKAMVSENDASTNALANFFNAHAVA